MLKRIKIDVDKFFNLVQKKQNFFKKLIVLQRKKLFLKTTLYLEKLSFCKKRPNSAKFTRDFEPNLRL